jgi:phosphohistidine phosphatase SixA
MSRTIYVVRHAISEANNRENIGTLAFGSPDAPLMDPLGKDQARQVGRDFIEQHGIHPGRFGTVAVSTMRRTDQTAELAGFSRRKSYRQLDEVAHGLPGDVLKEMLKRKEVPGIALKVARELLYNAPPEQVWFTHGLIIAGLTQALGQRRRFDHPRPAFGEIREFTIR